MTKVSIIIPLKEINDYVKESFSYIEKIDYDKSLLDIIVLPDTEGEIPGDFSFEYSIIPTGHIHPGEKRDMGIEKAKGNIKVLPPGGKFNFSLEVGALNSAEAKEMEAKINQIKES